MPPVTLPRQTTEVQLPNGTSHNETSPVLAMGVRSYDQQQSVHHQQVVRLLAANPTLQHTMDN